MRILFLSRWFPFPANNGAKLRISGLLRGLNHNNEITLISFSDQPDIDRMNLESQEICDETYAIPWKAYNPGSKKSLLGFLNFAPRSIVDTFSQDMASVITKTIKRNEFDVIIASSLTMASYVTYFKGISAILEELELGVPLQAISQPTSYFHRLRNRFSWYKLKKYLSKLLPNFQACTVVSEQEKMIFEKTFPKYHNIFVIPNCIDFNRYDSCVEKSTNGSLIFTGSFRYSANYDAMIWFLGEVLPRIRSKYPDVQLRITGDHANKNLPKSDNVTLTGYVDDIKSLVAQSWCSIAPLRIGGGTRLKILESMALKTPVITTSKGAEGLEFEHGKQLLIADSPDSFADCVIDLLSNTELREKLAENAYSEAKSKYDCFNIIPQFSQLIDKVVS